MRAKRIARAAGILALLTVALGELAARVLTRQGGNGIPMIGRYALLPYRPERSDVEVWAHESSEGAYLAPDPQLGWDLRANGTSELYTTNAQAIRADPGHEYTSTVPPGKVRIVALGDSFTHGDEVRNDETWERDLDRIRPELETLNLGVPGYGTDQAFLRWRRLGRKFESNIVLLGIWPEDICRNLNLVRFYIVANGMYASKPRFVLRDQDLQLLNSPAIQGADLANMLSDPDSAELLTHDAWFDRRDTQWKFFYASRLLRFADSLSCMKRRRDERQRMYSGEDPRAIELTVAIARRFKEEVASTGAMPLVLLIPMHDLLDLHSKENGFPLVRALRSAGVDVLDLGPAMARIVRDEETGVYLPSGHLSVAGNRIFAEQLSIALEPWIARARR